MDTQPLRAPRAPVGVSATAETHENKSSWCRTYSQSRSPIKCDQDARHARRLSRDSWCSRLQSTSLTFHRLAFHDPTRPKHHARHHSRWHRGIHHRFPDFARGASRVFAIPPAELHVRHPLGLGLRREVPPEFLVHVEQVHDRVRDGRAVETRW